MRIVALVLALAIVAGSVAPALADGGEGECPRAAQAAAMSQYLKSQGTVAEMPAAPTSAPAVIKSTTTTTQSGG